MVSLLVSRSSGLASSSDPGHCIVFLGKTVPLSTQEYKWVLANLMPGLTLRWTRIPSRGKLEILLVASCYRNRDELQPAGPLGSHSNFTFTLL